MLWVLPFFSACFPLYFCLFPTYSPSGSLSPSCVCWRTVDAHVLLLVADVYSLLWIEVLMVTRAPSLLLPNLSLPAASPGYAPAQLKDTALAPPPPDLPGPYLIPVSSSGVSQHSCNGMGAQGAGGRRAEGVFSILGLEAAQPTAVQGVWGCRQPSETSPS